MFAKGYFEETQRFSQIWLWVIILVALGPVVVIFGYGMVKQLVIGEPWGNQPMSDTGLMIASISAWGIAGGVVWMIAVSELQTEIKDRAIFYRFPIFINRQRRIAIQEIDKWQIIKFRPGKYGGYGIRKGLNKTTAYLVKGRNGMELSLKNGKSIVIGTQHPEAMKKAMQVNWDRHHEDHEQIL